MSEIETCPHCNADLRDGKISEKDRESFGDEEYFYKLIGIEDDSYDGITWWCCPECWVVWNHWNGKINTSMKEEKWFIAMKEREQCKDSEQ